MAKKRQLEAGTTEEHVVLFFSFLRPQTYITQPLKDQLLCAAVTGGKQDRYLLGGMKE